MANVMCGQKGLQHIIHIAHNSSISKCFNFQSSIFYNFVIYLFYFSFLFLFLSEYLESAGPAIPFV